MGLFIVRRRHRLLGLVLLVLAVAMWGLWLARSGRATDYSDTAPDQGSAAPAAVTSGVAAVAATSGAATPRQGRASSAVTKPSTGATRAVTGDPAAASPGGGDLSLAGEDDAVVFARRVASALLSYTPATDFAARNSAVMAVAALPPLGNPTELGADLVRYTPDPDGGAGGALVRFVADRVTVSGWAAARIAQLHLPDGTFGIDVTGRQIITRPGDTAVTVSVTVGITGACPPALSQCELDRVFPQTVQQELVQ